MRLDGTPARSVSFEDQITANEKQIRTDTRDPDKVEDNSEAQRLLAHAESLRVTNSLLAARIDQLNLQAKYLMQDHEEGWTKPQRCSRQASQRMGSRLA